MVLERLGDLAVEETQDLVAALDQRDLDAERRQHAGVLGADDAAADHDHGLGQMVELEQAVGTEDGLVVERDALGAGRPGAGRDHEDLGAEPLGVVRAGHLQQVGRDEVGLAPDQVDVIAVEVAADQLELVADDLLADEDQVGDRDVLLDPIALAEQPAIAGPGQVQDGLAEGLGWDRARVDRRAAQHGTLLDDDRLLAELRRLNRGLLTGRTRADHRAIEMPHRRCPRGVDSPTMGAS